MGNERCVEKVMVRAVSEHRSVEREVCWEFSFGFHPNVLSRWFRALHLFGIDASEINWNGLSQCS